ncbi:MAG: response regulator [Armatimonadia bacterium]|nr:response regulator [Armatimonadia bacterium]
MGALIRTLLAEDDAAFRELLRHALVDTGKVEIVAQATDGKECLQLQVEHEPDLVVLDIDMPVISGIEAAEIMLGSASPPLVTFVTAHSEYAARAFELQAVDYLVKPDEADELGAVSARLVERVEAALGSRERAVADLRSRLEAAIARLDGLEPSNPRSVRGRIAVKDRSTGAVRLLPTSRISHVARSQRSVNVYWEGQSFPTTYTVERLTERLGPEGFYRISPGVIVNLSAVGQVLPKGDGSYRVILADRDKTELDASRSRSKELLVLLGASDGAQGG